MRDRLWPLASGSTSHLSVKVPASRFEQIGSGMRVSARHYFPAGSAAVDSSPENDYAEATWIVDGRRTQSVKGTQ